MFLNFIYSFYKIRKTGSISHTLSKVFLLVDVLVQLVVMMGATMDHPDFTTGVVKKSYLIRDQLYVHSFLRTFVGS
ncbi:Chemotaxis protein [Leptospira interrogans serovar Canicola]|nr:Chemotaxis protein [Leptospira interrogans serovar Canicola]